MSDQNGDGKKTSSDFLRNPFVLAGAAVVIIAAIVGAYFLGSAHTGSGSHPASDTQSAQNLSARGICEASLDRLKNFGVVLQDTSLVSKDAADTGTKNRVTCTAKNGAVTFKITVDQLCSDMGNSRCIRLWNVTDSSGKVLFQHRGFLPPE